MTFTVLLCVSLHFQSNFHKKIIVVCHVAIVFSEVIKHTVPPILSPPPSLVKKKKQAHRLSPRQERQKISKVFLGRTIWIISGISYTEYLPHTLPAPQDYYYLRTLFLKPIFNWIRGSTQYMYVYVLICFLSSIIGWMASHNI